MNAYHIHSGDQTLVNDRELALYLYGGFDWGFDVREVQNANAFVWHSDDDSAIPAAQGKWLAEHLSANYRHASEGYGHMTYCAGKYQEPDKSLVAALLRGANQMK